MKAYLLAVCTSFAGKCGFYELEDEDSNTVILTIPATNAINEIIEVKLQIRANGLSVMWYYSKPLLVEDENNTADEKHSIIQAIATDYNAYDDSTDELSTHTLSISRGDGDFYWKAYYPKAMYFPWSEEGTIPVLRDIYFTQPQRIEKFCLPIISALIEQMSVEEACDAIREIREAK